MTSRAGSPHRSIVSLVLATFLIASGCTLITAVDEDKIPGATADASAGSGGTGGEADGSTGGSAGSDASAGAAGAAGSAGAAGNAGAAGSGGAAGGDAGDGGISCTTADNCPTPSNECMERTCDGGFCGEQPVAQGTAAATQTAGDCKESQCDGAGNVVDANDDTDVPEDNNDCTTDSCDNGTPSNTNASVGTSCGSGGALKCDGNGACVGCITEADCSGTNDECQTKTCTSGTCGFNYATQGTVLTTQTAGDCKEAQCDGSGGITQVTTTSDVPVDGNECTDDVCTQDVPSNPPASAGTACTTGGGKVCDGSGACVACTAPSQCGSDTECQVQTCTNNTCGVSNTADGTAVATQTAGDCKEVQCDGNGATKTVNADTDVPDDSNLCTTDTCVSGTPTYTPTSSGTSCGTNLLCDGSGNCLGCLTGADCPGTDDDCKTRTCTAGSCGFSYTANNTPVSSQTAGDCKEVQCDGAGGTKTVNKDTDLPDDSQECTVDSCNAGSPVYTPKSSGDACTQGGGIKCDGSGNCVECLAGADCGSNSECATYTCTANTCGSSFTADGTPLSSQTAGDCKEQQCNGLGGTKSVNKDTDLPDDGQECTDDTCSAGAPVYTPKTSGTACTQGGGSVCDASGSCVECLAAADCGTSTECLVYSCTAGVCGSSNTANGTPTSSQTAGDCKEEQCDGAGGTKIVNKDTDVFNDSNDCTDDVCTAGTPSNPPKSSGAACSTGGVVCDGSGNCVECLVASDCGTDDECKTFSCTAGTCGQNNTAAGTALASQTAGDCKELQCDGNGGTQQANLDTDVPVDGFQCTDDVCTAGVPSNPATTIGTACTEGGGSKCDGGGNCVECTVGSDCTSGVCTGFVCQAATCSDGVQNGTETDMDCGGTTCGPCAPGLACAVDGDCESNVCTGLVCASPNVLSTMPADAATGVNVGATISVTFTSAMDGLTLTAQTAPGACTGAVQVSTDDFTTCIGLTGLALSAGDTVATFTPAPALSYGSTYKIRVTTSAQDAYANPIAAQYTSTTGFTTAVPGVCSADVALSYVYGGGGNSGSKYTNDFIELHNRTATSIDLTGWSVQYASSSGSTWQVTPLSGSIAAGGYYLVQEAQGSGGTDPLPTPDATGSIAMAASNGKVALVSNTTPLTGTCATGVAVVDFLGYGSANCSETAASGALSNTNGALRGGSGCTDTDDNSSDFTVVSTSANAPRNSASATVACGAAVCGTNNESDTAGEADYCVLQSPPTLSATASTATALVYGRIYEAGVTDPAGASGSVTAEVGYGPTDSNPTTESGWTWTAASFNLQSGNDDEYQASFTAPATVGTYAYTYRFSLDGGTTWTYCDIDGAGSNANLGFEVTQLGQLTVQ